MEEMERGEERVWDWLGARLGDSVNPLVSMANRESMTLSSEFGLHVAVQKIHNHSSVSGSN